MLKGVNFARGWARIRADGPFPERLVNLLAQRAVLFWAVDRTGEESVELSVLRRDLRQTLRLATQAGCEAWVLQQVGLPNFLRRFRTRYAFLTGLALSVLTVCLLSNFVLSVEVTGHDRVTDAVILSQLHRQGLAPGVYGPRVDTRQLELELLLALDELSWASVNLNGTRAQIVVREKILPLIKNNTTDACTCVRTMKRKLASGMLYFIFNEGTAVQTVALDDISGTLYRLDAASGEITLLEDCEIEVVCGDIAVIYQTDAELDTVSEQTEYRIVLNEFRAVQASRFTVTLDGIGMQDFPACAAVSSEFSGEITYRTEYKLPSAPLPTDRFRISLYDTAVSARISVNGRKIATLGLTPMQTVVTGEQLPQTGVLEITVANTAANEIASKKELIAMHPTTVVGPVWWHEKSLLYETNAPAIRFGHAEISKLK